MSLCWFKTSRRESSGRDLLPRSASACCGGDTKTGWFSVPFPALGFARAVPVAGGDAVTRGPRVPAPAQRRGTPRPRRVLRAAGGRCGAAGACPARAGCEHLEDGGAGAAAAGGGGLRLGRAAAPLPLLPGSAGGARVLHPGTGASEPRGGQAGGGAAAGR